MSNAASLAAQAASTVESNFNMLGGLPRGAVRRALDADIAGEGGKVVGDVASGLKVILSDGTQVAYTPPPEKPNIPDWSNIKSIRHYFGARGYQPYPSWFYHPTKDAILVKDAAEAAELGIVFRKTSDDERQRYGRLETWDWEEGCQWRPNPVQKLKFNFADHAGSKNLISSVKDPTQVQSDLVASVAAAVAQVLKISPAANAPASVDQQQWDEFLAFQAWKKASEVVGAEIVSGAAEESATEEEQLDLSANALSPEQDRILWEAEGKRLGVKIDNRWSLETLKAKVQEKLDAES